MLNKKINHNKFTLDKLDILTPKNKYQFKKKNKLKNEISKDNIEENKFSNEIIYEKKKNNNLETSKTYSSTNKYWENRYLENEKKMDKIKKEEEYKKYGQIKNKPNISNNSKKLIKEIKTVSNNINKPQIQKIIEEENKKNKNIIFYQKYKVPISEFLDSRNVLFKKDEVLINFPIKRLLDVDKNMINNYNFKKNYNYVNKAYNVNNNNENYFSNQSPSLSPAYLSNQSPINSDNNLINQLNLNNQSNLVNLNNQLNLNNQSKNNILSNTDLNNMISTQHNNLNSNQNNIYTNSFPNCYEVFPQQSLIKKNLENYHEQSETQNNNYRNNNYQQIYQQQNINPNNLNENYSPNYYNNYNNNNDNNYYNNNIKSDAENEKRIIEENKNLKAQMFSEFENTNYSNNFLRNDKMYKYEIENNRLKDLEEMINYLYKISDNKSDSLKKKIDNTQIKNELDSAKNDLENLNEKLKVNDYRRKVFMKNNNTLNNLNRDLNCFINKNNNNNNFNKTLVSMNQFIYPDKIERFDFQN